MFVLLNFVSQHYNIYDIKFNNNLQAARLLNSLLLKNTAFSLLSLSRMVSSFHCLSVCFQLVEWYLACIAFQFAFT